MNLFSALDLTPQKGGKGLAKAMVSKDSHVQDTDEISSFFLTVLVNIKVVEQAQHGALKL